MFTKDEQTEERVDAYVDALEWERKGYEARLAAVGKNRDERLDADQLQDRIDQVDAEIARVKPGKAKKDAGVKKDAGKDGSDA
jgi:uncharacterized small protein (DUF1192 family)